MIVGLILYPLYKYFKKPDPEPIFGIYPQKGKWYFLKYIIFLIVLYFRKWTSGKQPFSKDNIGKYAELEKPQILSNHPKAFNAVFYAGGNSDGYKFAMGTERRVKGMVHAVFYIVVPNKGLFKLPVVPDTLVFSTQNGEEGSGFEAGGIESFAVQPMKQWRLKYSGKLRNETSLVDAEFDALFDSSSVPFDFDTDLHPKLVAQSIATNKWSREYFEILKTAHQSRYEQMGTLTCKLKIDGDEESTFKMNGFRDVSTGSKRDWSLMHRYAYFILFTNDGLCASLGIVLQPCTGLIKFGHVRTVNNEIIPIDWIDFELFQHGEGGEAPQDHAFRFRAGGVYYTVQILVQHESTHYVSPKWEAKMVERFVDGTINGIQCYGISEFNYSHKNGRPALDTDPQWFKKSSAEC